MIYLWCGMYHILPIGGSFFHPSITFAGKFLYESLVIIEEIWIFHKPLKMLQSLLCQQSVLGEGHLFFIQLQ